MTTKRPDAIITDLDGSLLGPDGKVGRRDLAAIRRMRKMGIPVLPGTGRPPMRTRPLVKELGLELALCSNGGCCYDFVREAPVFLTTMDHGIAQRLMDWLLAEEIPFLLHTPARTYRSPGAERIAKYDTRCREVFFSLTPGMSLDGLDILKLLAVRCDEAAVMAQAETIFSKEELAVCTSEAEFVDFNPAGVTKGSGLRRLADRMGWRMENILALGDNHNDRTMLEAVEKSAVPASGMEKIKEMAGFVTAPCGEDPLAAAIDHYFPGLLEGMEEDRTN